MQIVSTVAEVRQAVEHARRSGKRIGFVATMGALHEGHGALIDRSVQECAFTVVSIFVNPLQFNDADDLNRYPRDLGGDAAFCRARGVDLIFAPSPQEMYPTPSLTFVDVEGLTEGLCGASRPGHFRGVATVVSKLFHMVMPDRAYFGEKDFQQLTVIKRMVQDLNFPLDVVAIETVREPDGLALSSRNRHLSAEERRAARVIYRSLLRARELLERGERDMDVVREAVRELWAAEPLIQEEYVEIVDAERLSPIADLVHGQENERHSRTPVDEGDGRALVAVAVMIGTTRLIDNIVVTLPWYKG